MIDHQYIVEYYNKSIAHQSEGQQYGGDQALPFIYGICSEEQGT